MKKLNAISTHQITTLVCMIEAGQLLTFYAPMEPPVHLRILGNVITKEGIGKVISIGKILDERSKTYSILMEFIVINSRKAKKTLVYPRLFQDDYNGIKEESVCIKNGKVVSYNIVSQIGQANFAFLWLSDLRTEGYLTNFSFCRTT